MSNMVSQDRTAEPSTSVDKALRLLLLLAEERLVTVSQAGAALNVARSTAHRLLGTLQTYGFAEQDPVTKAYRPGHRLLEAGLAAVGSLDIRNIARPELEALAHQLGETVHLIALAGPDTLVLDSVESTQVVRVSSRAGGSMPPHCTSAGKVLLARLQPEHVERLLGPDPLPSRTPSSITTHAQLREELDRVRARGYATNLGENETGVAAVGVAIPATRGDRPTAVVVASPSMRFTDERLPELVEAARVAAQRIADQLDGRTG